MLPRGSQIKCETSQMLPSPSSMSYANDWGDGDNDRCLDGGHGGLVSKTSTCTRNNQCGPLHDKKSDESKSKGAESVVLSVAELARKAERCEPSLYRPHNSIGSTCTSSGPTR